MNFLKGKRVVQRESNTSRIWVALSGAFGLIVLALRQQGCVLCIQKHPNISPPNVLCSFFGAEICSDEALATENPCRIVKANNNVRANFRPRKTDWGSTPVGLSKRFVAAALVVLVLAIIAGACVIYVRDYYRTDLEAVEAFAPMDSLSVEQLDDGTLVFKPENATKGFIFYPGGKVEYTAYQPLLAACAQQGVLCVLVEMPFNLAVLDINAAEGIQEQYPEMETWYIGGHSLGGSMAASYVAEHRDEYDGLILLGSYSTADLSESGLDVLSVYGSEDTVMNRGKYDENKSNLPDDFVEVVIEGGCHAYFGMYGAQDGDGKPGISNEEQIALTAEQIIRIME